jgi:hypothetical protein
LKHCTHNHQNTFTSVSSGPVSILSICFEVRKTNLKWGPFFPSVCQFVCSSVLLRPSTGDETFYRNFVILGTGVPKNH